MAHRLEILPTPHDHYLGRLEAPIVLVEYGDYECPKCAMADHWVDKLLHEFDNKICYVYRHFPLTDLHPHSALAAMAAEACSKKARFWEMHHDLFENSQFLTGESIINLAEEKNIDVDHLILDLNKDELMENICNDIVSGEESEVKRTPTFFLNGEPIDENVTYESLKQTIYELLKKKTVH